jgi:hypothetical protein
MVQILVVLVDCCLGYVVTFTDVFRSTTKKTEVFNAVQFSLT